MAADTEGRRYRPARTTPAKTTEAGYGCLAYAGFITAPKRASPTETGPSPGLQTATTATTQTNGLRRVRSAKQDVLSGEEGYEGGGETAPKIAV